MPSDFKDLYPFRTSKDENSEYDAHPTRTSAARKLRSYINAGADPESIIAEQYKGGQWQHDEQTFTSLRSLLEKQAQNGTSVTKTNQMNMKRAKANLMQIARLISGADEVTPAHMEALDRAHSDLNEMFDAQ